MEKKWFLEEWIGLRKDGPRMDNAWGDGPKEKVGFRKRWGLGRIR